MIFPNDLFSVTESFPSKVKYRKNKFDHYESVPVNYTFILVDMKAVAIDNLSPF